MPDRWITLTMLLLVCQAPAQLAKSRCGEAGTISLRADVDDSFPHPSVNLNYSLEQPAKVSNVRIEVWDRPTLLFQTPVTKEKVGKVVWRPNAQLPTTPFALQVKISVPKDIFATEDSRVLIGSTGSVDHTPDPKLLSGNVVLQEGAGTTSLIERGTDLSGENTVLLLMEEESPGIWIAREYLPATLVDLSHVSVDIPSGYLSKPTRLQLKAMSPTDTSEVAIGTQVEDDINNAETIYVTRKDRPILSKVEPSVVKAVMFDGTEKPVTILGSGFTAESRVLVGWSGGFGSYAVTPNFISDQELQLRIPAGLQSTPDDEPLRLWVRNGDDQHISDPQILSVDHSDLWGWVERKWPWITAVSPYPVPLMDRNSPTGVWLEIHGQNFTKDNVLILDNGPLGPTGELKTKFISSEELTTWLPREFWRRHELFSRLVVQTSSGTCAAELRQER